jgi:tetratricopeptide (TPR) repeat protein
MSEELSRNQAVQLERALIEAEGFLELGLPKLALKALERIRPLMDNEPVALAMYGEILRMLDRFEEALPPLRRAVELRPGLLPAYLAIGWCAKRTGRLSEAIAALEKALEIAPSDGLVHYNLACYLSLAGRRSEALHQLREAIRLDRKFQELARTESDFDPIRGDEEFESLLEYDPSEE